MYLLTFPTMKLNHQKLANKAYGDIYYPPMGTEHITDTHLVNEYASDSQGNGNECRQMKSMLSPFIYPPNGDI